MSAVLWALGFVPMSFASAIHGVVHREAIDSPMQDYLTECALKSFAMAAAPASIFARADELAE